MQHKMGVTVLIFAQLNMDGYYSNNKAREAFIGSPSYRREEL